MSAGFVLPQPPTMSIMPTIAPSAACHRRVLPAGVSVVLIIVVSIIVPVVSVVVIVLIVAGKLA